MHTISTCVVCNYMCVYIYVYMCMCIYIYPTCVSFSLSAYIRKHWFNIIEGD